MRLHVRFEPPNLAILDHMSTGKPQLANCHVVFRLRTYTDLLLPLHSQSSSLHSPSCTLDLADEDDFQHNTPTFTNITPTNAETTSLLEFSSSTMVDYAYGRHNHHKGIFLVATIITIGLCSVFPTLCFKGFSSKERAKTKAKAAAQVAQAKRKQHDAEDALDIAMAPRAATGHRVRESSMARTPHHKHRHRHHRHDSRRRGRHEEEDDSDSEDWEGG